MTRAEISHALFGTGHLRRHDGWSRLLLSVLPASAVAGLVLFFPPTAARGQGNRGVAVEVREQRYPVTGSTSGEVWRSLHRAARREDDRIVVAWTDYWLEKRIWMGEEPGGRCHVVDALVRVRMVATVPGWTPPAGVPFSLTRQWARYERAIRRHERGHVERAGRMGRRLRDELLGLVAPDCRTLQGWIRWVQGRVAAWGEAAQRRYDEETNHGQTQGVRWRTPEEPRPEAGAARGRFSRSSRVASVIPRRLRRLRSCRSLRT